MGAKKKEAKKKGDDDGDNPAEIGAILEAEVDGLRAMLVLEQQRCEKSGETVQRVAEGKKDILEALKQEEKQTKACVTQMAEQYKRMEERLTANIDELEGTVETQEAQVKSLNEEILRKREERDRQNQEMDDRIAKLNLKINEMASEFSDILKDALHKMQDRVEFANKDYSDADVGAELQAKISQLQN